MWGAFEESIERLLQDREQRRLLPGVRVPASVRLTANDADCFAAATLVLSAVPTQFMRPVWKRLVPPLPPGRPIVSAAKGIDNHTLPRPTQTLPRPRKSPKPPKPPKPGPSWSRPALR